MPISCDRVLAVRARICDPWVPWVQVMSVSVTVTACSPRVGAVYGQLGKWGRAGHGCGPAGGRGRRRVVGAGTGAGPARLGRSGALRGAGPLAASARRVAGTRCPRARAPGVTAPRRGVAAQLADRAGRRYGTPAAVSGTRPRCAPSFPAAPTRRSASCSSITRRAPRWRSAGPLAPGRRCPCCPRSPRRWRPRRWRWWGSSSSSSPSCTRRTALPATGSAAERARAYLAAWAHRRGFYKVPGGLLLIAGSPLARQLRGGSPGPGSPVNVLPRPAVHRRDRRGDAEPAGDEEAGRDIVADCSASRRRRGGRQPPLTGPRD